MFFQPIYIPSYTSFHIGAAICTEINLINLFVCGRQVLSLERCAYLLVCKSSYAALCMVDYGDLKSADEVLEDDEAAQGISSANALAGESGK